MESPIRRELIVQFEHLVWKRARARGIELGSFREWVDSIVGEGIAVAMAQQERWDPRKGDFLTWCFLKTRYLIRAALSEEGRQQRAVQRLRVLAPTAQRQKTYPDTLAMREEVIGILERLTPMQQKALVLYYINGMSAGTLAQVLGKNVGAVHQLLRRARLKACRVATSGDELASGLREEPVTLPPEERERRKAAQELALELLFGLLNPSDPS